MKSKDVIVYKGTGHAVILTRADFQSDEEFEKWHRWLQENAADKRLGRAVCLWEDMNLLEAPAYKATLQREENLYLWRIAKQNLTEKQYRRLYMCAAEGMTLQEIALKEGTCFQAIHKSIVSAKEKMKKLLEKRNRKGRKTSSHF